MTQNEIKQILDRQRAFFHTGATLDVSYRLDSLAMRQISTKLSKKILGKAPLKPTCVKPDLY